MIRRCTSLIGVLLFAAGLYGLTFHGYVDIEDVEVCYQATRNVVANGSLALAEGEISDEIAAAGFYVVRAPDGEVYPIYPLLQILLPVPFYWVGEQLSGLASSKPEDVVRMAYSSVNVVVGVLLAGVVYLLARSLGQGRRLAGGTAWLATCGTMLWWYAQNTFPDPALALFSASSVWCLWQSRSRPVVLWLMAAGVLHGLAILMRPAGVLLLLPAAWYLWRRGWSAYVWFGLPLVLCVAGGVYLDLVVFGRPLEASYLGAASETPPVWTHSYTLGVFGQLFSDGRGLFVLSPALLTALLAYPKAYGDRRPEAVMVAMQLGVLVAFFAAFSGWYGGWNWGPRYLLPVVPLLAALAGNWLLDALRWRALVVALVAAASIAIQGLSVAVPHRVPMTVAASRGDGLTDHFFYSRCSPIRTHALILAHKLEGGEEGYSPRDLFGVGDDRKINVLRVPHPRISRFNQGFESLAWVRVHQKGHVVVAWAAVAAGLLSILGGTWLVFRRRGVDPTASP